MEKDITLEELHYVADQLARNKMPRWDGLLVEFYLFVWDDIGPILLEVLKAGLKSGRLHPRITHGMLVLLAKKGDPLMIGNKRGLTCSIAR